MRGIALAIVVGLWGGEIAVRGKEISDLPTDQRILGGALSVACLFCIVLGF